mmetsp:Transcript_15084/g.17074  ORF Transcript_15084/g.17074 Transcript_15084/m.17074 type:complete len:162 (-) Transcript_15084:264-749(-)|eukprot:CAMPEP_0184057610 /NCGR_PEP_ID=MMETSP0956-20121227/8608_1 /TAXON_ID=627963 /ORGANISM="Aplanochytrium sp, Strain PBS07" /LENGTH=161 /DNA_ID=CAMNT_0026352125 /DNA_START=241 /DNA_END=726 /DNA_ORIENTATION=-
MKPAWDKLMKEYEGNDKILVADVDCTAAGKPLCDSNGVKGFPTIKYGDANALEDYSGGRDFNSLSSFAGELKPVCSPANLENCDEEGKAQIEKYSALSEDELKSAIEEAEKKIQDAESNFKAEVEKLQATYQQLMTDKDATIKAVKDSGLGTMKTVLATKA